MCEFTAGIAAFRKLAAAVVCCSCDSLDTCRRFIAKHRLKVTLLSDPTHATMESCGAWGKKVLYGKTSTRVIRSTVLLDPVDLVAHHWKKVKAAGHAAHVKSRLAWLREDCETHVTLTGW